MDLAKGLLAYSQVTSHYTNINLTGRKRGLPHTNPFQLGVGFISQYEPVGNSKLLQHPLHSLGYTHEVSHG